MATTKKRGLLRRTFSWLKQGVDEDVDFVPIDEQFGMSTNEFQHEVVDPIEPRDDPPVPTD